MSWQKLLVRENELKLHTPNVSYTTFVVRMLYPEGYEKHKEKKGFKGNLRCDQTLECQRYDGETSGSKNCARKYSSI